MYTVLDYANMAADGVRMDAYARAIARVVKPGSVVIDLGAGTGIFSLLAVRAGAKRVHAIEPNPAIWLLPDLARENGMADKIEIHPTTCFEVTLAEKADVLISDLRGSGPLNHANLRAVRDVKERLLVPGGTILPARDRLFAALVEARTIGDSFARAREAFEGQGLKASAMARSIANTPLSTRRPEISASDLLTSEGEWGTIDYGSHEGVVEKALSLSVRRSGTARAISVWFEGTIHEELTFTTKPGTMVIYSSQELPLERPIRLEPGDRVELLIRADEKGERWAWETTVTGTNGVVREKQRQASFFGLSTSPAAILRASSSSTPQASPRGARAGRILELMDGSRTVAQIADAIGDASTPRDLLLEEVRDLVDRYAR